MTRVARSAFVTRLGAGWRASLLAAASLGLFGCTTVRQLREPASIPPNGHAERTRTGDALDYSVAIKIAAPPRVVWDVLVDAPAYTSWNSTIVKLDGAIAPGERLKLVSKDAPDRTFKLRVSAFQAPARMVWEDGGDLFLGVRTFTLTPGPEGATTFTMSETLSGGMLGMIEGSLPDFTKSFDAFAADLKKAAEGKAGPALPAAPATPTAPTAPSDAAPPAAAPAPVAPAAPAAPGAPPLAPKE